MRKSSLLLLILFLLPSTTPASAYSVQTHEALIDLAWRQSIQPLLLQRFPTLTEAQLQRAHAYAYGGCAIQDFGYYPFGNAFFSNLTHYVRSGDFVLALLQDARTPNELAFAIGSLAHYVGDTIGHGRAVNHAVALQFPALEARFGPSVNYAQSPHAHVQTEFAFDIDELSRNHFAPSGYLKHIGLNLPSRLLNQAFFETYGIHLPDLLGSKQAALRIYRFGVRSFLPSIARAETLLHHFPPDDSSIPPSTQLAALRADFLLAEADNNWKQYERKPGVRSHIFAAFIYILPKVGVLSLLNIKGPTPQAEELYIQSVYQSIASLRLVLTHFDQLPQYLPNRDLDTGYKVKPGGYPLTDKTYARLVDKLAKLGTHPNQRLPASLKQDIADYYADPSAPITTKNNPQDWAKLQYQLKLVQSIPSLQTQPALRTTNIPESPLSPTPSE